MGNFIDLTGRKFGRLTVLKRVENDKHKYIKWLCMCDCGIKKIIMGSHLKNGNTKSCGCFRREQARIKRTSFKLSGEENVCKAGI